MSDERRRDRKRTDPAPGGRWAPIVVTPAAFLRLIRDTARAIRARRRP